MEQPPETSTGWGAGKHAVELYVRTYTTMLQSSGEIKIDSLVQTHIRMGSVLHPLAGQPQSDMGALLYGVRRLPRAIERCRHVVMGQSAQGFIAHMVAVTIVEDLEVVDVHHQQGEFFLLALSALDLELPFLEDTAGLGFAALTIERAEEGLAGALEVAPLLEHLSQLGMEARHARFE